MGDNVLEYSGASALTLLEYLAGEADGVITLTLLNDLLKRIKRAAADKEYILCVYLNKLLIRVLASALRGYVCNRSFKDLEKCLLNALTGNVSRYGAVFASSRDFIDLVDINDSSLGKAYIVISRLNELEEDILANGPVGESTNINRAPFISTVNIIHHCAVYI